MKYSERIDDPHLTDEGRRVIAAALERRARREEARKAAAALPSRLPPDESNAPNPFYSARECDEIRQHLIAVGSLTPAKD